jgi:hypothetical protein
MCLLFVFLLTMRLAAWLRQSRRDETWKTAEILILRHQLILLQRRQPRRPKLNWADRALLATLLGVIPKARRDGLRLLVTPDTILRWHRNIVCRRWATRSRRGNTNRPATPPEHQGAGPLASGPVEILEMLDLARARVALRRAMASDVPTIVGVLVADQLGVTQDGIGCAEDLAAYQATFAAIDRSGLQDRWRHGGQEKESRALAKRRADPHLNGPDGPISGRFYRMDYLFWFTSSSNLSALSALSSRSA